MNPAIEDDTLEGEAPDARQSAGARSEHDAIYREMWERTQTTSAKYYDRKHKAMHYRVGDEVLLSSKNLTLRK
ncbi:hypothetical protein ACT02N_29895, partial [Pseudomonas aeruginosa]|uniref:hypothetical protein n=1 Tax=Pseudomonas aeruginosa TaxID=287 RepID=UPI00402B18C4